MPVYIGKESCHKRGGTMRTTATSYELMDDMIRRPHLNYIENVALMRFEGGGRSVPLLLLVCSQGMFTKDKHSPRTQRRYYRAKSVIVTS